MSRFTEQGSAISPPRPGVARTRLLLLGGFRLLEKEAEVALAEGSQRLLAFLALQRRPVRRALVAGTLWPDATEARALASLRSALARLCGSVRGVVEVSPTDLRLAEGIEIDLHESGSLAHRLLDAGNCLREQDVGRAAVTALSAELLPDWYDDWVVLEAEQWRQLRLHALEALAGLLTAKGRYADAAAAALAATRADPLRESALAALIRVHLAEHNRSEALREFRRYRDLLRTELDLEPTPQLNHLIQKGGGTVTLG